MSYLGKIKTVLFGDSTNLAVLCVNGSLLALLGLHIEAQKYIKPGVIDFTLSSYENTIVSIYNAIPSDMQSFFYDIPVILIASLFGFAGAALREQFVKKDINPAHGSIMGIAAYMFVISKVLNNLLYEGLEEQTISPSIEGVILLSLLSGVFSLEIFGFAQNKINTLSNKSE